MDKIQGMMPSSPSGQKSTMKNIFSYAFDYVVVAVLAVAYGFLDKYSTPFAQPFSVQNISLQYPMAIPERIPIWQCMVYSCLAPAGIIAIYTLFLDGTFSKSKKSVSRAQRYTWSSRLWELNCGILGLFLAQGTAFVITGSLKNLIGKPRPDLLARCILPTGTVDPTGPGFGLTKRSQCTQTDSYILQDGFRSFPSGHSSSAFAGLFFLSLYLAAKLHVLDQRGEVWRTFVVIVPSLAAACIAGSRIIDARHHPFDVMFGSALGILCGWACYRQYFPPISHTWEKGRAYPMRTWGVPLRRPDGVVGTDGQVYGYGTRKVDRTANAMMEDTMGDEEDRRHLVGMEPIRGGNQTYATQPPPPFSTFQQRNVGTGSSPSDEDTDYEHVRVKGSTITTIPAESLTRSGNGSPLGNSENAFRQQVDRNTSLRRSDEQDMTTQQQRTMR